MRGWSTSRRTCRLYFAGYGNQNVAGDGLPVRQRKNMRSRVNFMIWMKENSATGRLADDTAGRA
jgi:hypothetical protein